MKEEKKEKQEIQEKPEKKERKYKFHFLPVFWNGLKENKLYLLSFLITLGFIVFSSCDRVKDSEGFYSFKFNKEDVVDKKSDEGTTSATANDEVDVKNYIGVYSREVNLIDAIKVGSCSLDSYKIVYQIRNDRTITKYFYNSCLGTIKIWSEELKYASSSGARYISANNIYFLFGNSGMKEVDGFTYKLDSSENMKENKKVKDVDLYFYDNNIVLLLNDNLVLVDGDTISYNLKDEYKSNGGNLDKLVYKMDDYTYKFIVFSSGDAKSCYDSSNDDSLNYTIYSITYDTDNKKFGNVKEIVSRKISDGCSLYKTDLKEFE